MYQYNVCESSEWQLQSVNQSISDFNGIAADMLDYLQ